MWPTFLTAYHFPMKMESLPQAHVSSEQQPARSHLHARTSMLIVKSSVCCMLPSVSAQTGFFHVCYLNRNAFTAVSAGFSLWRMLPTYTLTPRSSSILSLCHSVNTMCHLVVLMESDSTLKSRRQIITMAPQREKEGWRNRFNCVFRSEDRKHSISLCSSTLHTRTQTQMRALGAHTQSLWHWWS